MAEAIRMPLLSDTMKEGVIAAWHKNVGDIVKSDDIIADVETDKATMEVMPYIDGTLLYIGVEKGKAAKINEIIAIIGKPGEDIQHFLNESVAPVETATAPSAPVEAAPVASAPVELKDATVIRMPLLSDTMKEGKIVAWHKKVGDSIKSDDILADVETDKATMEVMPYVDGTLLYVGVKEGEAAKINEIIAIVGKAGTDVAAYLASERNQEVATKETAPAAANTTASTTNATSGSTNTTPVANGTRILISPLAKKIAHQCEGNYNKALHLLHKDDDDSVFEEWFINWVRAAFKAKGNASVIADLISWSSTISKEGRETQKNFLQFCIQFFRQALLLNYQATDLVYLEPNFENFKLEKFAPFVHGNNIADIFKELEDAIYHIERNGNSNIILTDLSIKLTRLIHKKQ